MELGVFDALGEGSLSSAELAGKAGVPERGMRILCDYLAIQGLIAKSEARYAHTATSAAFLDRRSPVSMAPTLPFMMNNKIMTAFRGLTETIRQGRTSLEEPLAGEEAAEWVLFARSMQPMMAAAAEFIAEIVLSGGMPARVLDVAASHGLFGFAVVRRAPACELVVQDFPSVLDVTSENARAAGVPVTLLPGSAFTVELGTGYDVVLVPNFFHHFSVDDNITLMKRFYNAMRPGGRMMILEMVPNEDHLTPPTAASFAMMMLGNTVSGDAYTMAEYGRMLDAANFGQRELMDVPMAPQQLIVATR